MEVEDYLGKKAYKNKGFFSQLIGVIELNEQGLTKYILNYPSGSKCGFNKLSEITIVKD